MEILVFKSRRIERITEGVPTVVVENGQFQYDGLRKERVTEAEILSLLRQQSIDDLREVKLGTLETSGHLTVIQHEWAQPLQKGDLKGEEARQKWADTGGQQEPPPEKRTTSPRALGREAA